MKISIVSFSLYVLMICFWLSIIGGFLFFTHFEGFITPKSVITVFAWGDIFDPLYIKEFERETGIKVVMSYYASNEELLVKLKATGGKGYDIIIPSDYILKQLREENLLKELDKEKLLFFKQLNPQLLNLPFDPDNKYSIPFEWEVFGLGINRDYFKEEIVASWDLIFKQPPYRITMVNDPLEAFSFAAYFLYGPQKSFNNQQIEGIKKLLIQQKKWVEAYVNFRADYFLITKNCPLVVASSSYIMRALQEYPFVDFIIPQEGTFMTIENIAIPRASTHDDFIYQFINFLYRPESMRHHFNKFGFFPARLDVITVLTTDEHLNRSIQNAFNNFDRYFLFNKIIQDQSLRDLWVTIKSS
ncbi:MAG: spermidine/putrescine ABC transporter substrate-binding protein [Candidatus Babeliaceae bacterium]